MRFKSITKPERCPKCDSTSVAEIKYGFPFGLSSEIEQGLADGVYIYGGCCGDEEWEPAWQCRECGAEIEKTEQ